MNVGNLEDGVGASQGGVTGHYQLQFKTDPGEPLPDWAIGSDVSCVLNDDNSAILEIFVDWLDLPDQDGFDFTPDGTSLLGFDVTVVDNDGEGRARLCWVNDGTVTAENWSTMDGAGVTGAEVKRISNAEGHVEVDLSEISEGIYFVTVRNNDNAFTHKIVKN